MSAVADEPFDVAVIGAGVVGSAIAWQLSLCDVRVLWLDASYDVGDGTSKANAGLAVSGYDTEPGTLETTLVRESNLQWEDICSRLDVPFRRCGALVLAFDESDVRTLDALAQRAEADGVPSSIITGDEARSLAEMVSPKARAALHVPDESIVDPMRLTVAYAELAVCNGVQLRLSTPVTGFRNDSSRNIALVETSRGAFSARYVVNAAGLHADEISALGGDQSFRIWPRKGQFLVLDRDIGQRVGKIIASPPSDRTRGVVIAPTTNMSALVGATAEDIDDKTDHDTDGPALDRVLREAVRLAPALHRRHIIKTFAGLRPASDQVYHVERSSSVRNLIHAAAIRSTGVSSSPAVAHRVCDLLEESGLELRLVDMRSTTLRHVPRLAEVPTTDIPGLVRDDPGYGMVVCTCEHVSAAEIRQALQSPVPATSIDGVRKRTRATAGRCQGSYCMAGVGFLLSTRHGFDPHAIPQGAPDSTWGLARQ